ncbi:MAG: FtsX-like permease family protein [Veillonella parvula]
MMIVMLCLMVILLSFIFALSIVSKIQEESEIIGILLANGYKKSELVLNYIANSVIITFLAAVLGNILPYAITITTSGCNASNSALTCSSRKVTG